MTAVRPRVVGLGEPAAGDDGVGVAVVEHLRRSGDGVALELLTAADASALVDLLVGADPVVIVDAIATSGPPGRVLTLTPAALATRKRALLSTHGVEVPQAIGLARTLCPATVARTVRIVAVTIAAPHRYASGLSAAVAAAIPVAAAAALRLARKTRATRIAR
jgi:hydrogenase maturation protease